MGRKCIRSPSLIITEQPAWCAAARPMIFSPSPVNQTSRSWKPRHSLATSSQDVFRMDQHSPSFSTNTRRKPVQSLCIQKNRWSVQPQAAAVTRQKEKNEREFPQSALTAHKIMIGEGTKSTNQRRHNYVQENVEVGFFTDPTVCIGCKACEVACKDWNEVPDDGFTWIGFFLILGEPEAYGLPPKPQVPTIYLKSAWTSALLTSIAALIAVLGAFLFFG